MCPYTDHKEKENTYESIVENAKTETETESEREEKESCLLQFPIILLNISCIT